MTMTKQQILQELQEMVQLAVDALRTDISFPLHLSVSCCKIIVY